MDLHRDASAFARLEQADRRHNSGHRVVIALQQCDRLLAWDRKFHRALIGAAELGPFRFALHRADEADFFEGLRDEGQVDHAGADGHLTDSRLGGRIGVPSATAAAAKTTLTSTTCATRTPKSSAAFS